MCAKFNRLLRPGALFKFQVQGYAAVRSPTWTIAGSEVRFYRYRRMRNGRYAAALN